MTPKEKAKELVSRYSPFAATWDYTNDDAMPEDIIVSQCKGCALIAADTHLNYSENDSPYGSMGEWMEGNKYWWEVKEEINKL